MAVILGIDLGTQSVKAMLLDADQGEIAVAGKEYEVIVPEADFAEEDVENWWKCAKEVLKRLQAEAPKAFEAISGVGITGQMHGMVALGKDLRPVTPAIIWVDQRSKKQVKQIYAKLDGETLASKVQNRIFTGFAFPSLLWIKEERPELYAKVHKICSPKDYIRLKLTGELGCEMTDASAMTMFDLSTRNWYYDALDAFGMDRDIFPACHESTDIAGSVTQSAECETGIKQGIPVIYGSGDQSGLTMGNGVYKEGLLVANIGTGATMATYSDKDVFDPQLRTHTFCNAIEKSYVVFGAILGGGISMRWMRDNILSVGGYQDMTTLAGQVGAGSGGMFFLPYLGGERTPHMNPNAEGMFFGLKLKHDKRHMIRSVMEGVVYAMKDSLTVLEEIGITPECIIASGGGARSALWLQMQADIFGREIAVTQAREQAALGIALVAGIGTGIFKNAEEACAKHIKFEEMRYYPNQENAALYVDGYETFCSLYRTNETLINHVAEVWNNG